MPIEIAFVGIFFVGLFLGFFIERTRSKAALSVLENRLSVFESSKESMGTVFENLAQKIFEEKSEKFVKKNNENLEGMLNPLRTQIQEFRSRVDQVHNEDNNARSELKSQVEALLKQNQTLSKEANNLAQALKGSVKAQGNFGEWILEQLLESTGFRKGVDYETQGSYSDDDGSRFRPDVIVKVPENRNIIIDSKVTLTAYDSYASAETEEDRNLYLKAHLASVRNHLKGLSDKEYQRVVVGQNLDFVLMFVAIEPAVMLAVTNDNTLFQDAWEKNVLIVSPSTLLFVLRTIKHLWRLDQQNKSAMDIAGRAAKLYDKFVGLVGDLENVGKQIDRAHTVHDEAMKKLTGRGGLVGRVEYFKKLGVSPTKSLPTNLLPEEADTDD